MPRVLLTGFGPFGEHEVNPTEAIVQLFPSLIPIKNPFGKGSSEVSIEKRVLTVDELGSQWTAHELASREWDAILHLGLCGQCTRPRIEVRYISKEYINKIIKEHIEDGINHRLLIWSFMNFEWWCKIFINKEKLPK